MKLFIVGTPIGNLGDISPRALNVLANCDCIAAEDTRVTHKLLQHFGLHTPMLSYHEHNRHMRGAELLARLQQGQSIALVTDAGMPAISDPGEDLVRAAHEQNIPIESVPGPTAFATALALSGLPSGRFCFEGFLSTNRKNRHAHLKDLRQEARTMLFYEAPHKLPHTLCDFVEFFGERPMAIVRELTKVHEEVIRCTCTEAAKRYGATPVLKGELVLVLAGAPRAAAASPCLPQAVALAQTYRQAGSSLTLAAKQAATQTGCRKNEIYRALAQGD